MTDGTERANEASKKAPGRRITGVYPTPPPKKRFSQDVGRFALKTFWSWLFCSLKLRTTAETDNSKDDGEHGRVEETT